MSTESVTSSSSNHSSSSVNEHLSNVADSMEGYSDVNNDLEVDNSNFDSSSSVKETIENVTSKSYLNWKYILIVVVLLGVAFFYFRKIKREK